ncbi:uncharacterized protein LOC125438079 [Sphaerodactylus townsendi]|uniref:uncharacterized protein LOC125438079 n=1 Tax=Sphaerodactylus townsendi TaxID=933632 RepID=UPI002026C8BF|nr:uncharacterized protein LOC125438079 [Sphaerodactylus townsendi]
MQNSGGASVATSANSDKQTGGRGVAWREAETRDLISIWGEEAVQSALQKTHKNMDVFVSVASQMRGMGHNRSAVECRTKAKGLKRDLKKCKQHNSISGNARKTIPFYSELDRIFANDKSVNNDDPYRAAECVYVSRRAPSAAETSHASLGATQRTDVVATQSSRRTLMTINEMDIRPQSPSLLESGAGSHSQEHQLRNLRMGEDLDATMIDQEALLEEAALRDDAAGELVTAMADQEEHQPPGEDVLPPAANTGQPSAALEAEQRATRQRIRLRRVGILADFARAIVEQGEAEAQERWESRQEDRTESRERFDSLMTEIRRGNSAMESMVDIFRQRFGRPERVENILETLVNHVLSGVAAGEQHPRSPGCATVTPSPDRHLPAASPHHFQNVHRECQGEKVRTFGFPSRVGSNDCQTPPDLAPATPCVSACGSHGRANSTQNERENRPPLSRSLHFTASHETSPIQGKVNQRESHVLGKSGNGLPAKRQCLREQMEQSSAGNVQGREFGRGAIVRTRKQKQKLDL